MKIRFLYTLLVAALVASSALALTGLPATAETQTIMVRLDSGELVPVQVQVDPGQDLEDIEIPDLPGGGEEPVPGTPTTPTTPTTPESGTPESTEQEEQDKSRSRKRAKKEDPGDELEEVETDPEAELDGPRERK